MSFGDYDTVVVVEMPGSIGAAAFSIAVSAGGSCKAVKTTPMLTVQEGMEAMRKATSRGYRPVSQTMAAR